MSLLAAIIVFSILYGIASNWVKSEQVRDGVNKARKDAEQDNA